jgi:16S rRNA processing protein RimM
MKESPGEMLVVGRITGSHGIRGWVKVHAYTEPLENFLEFGSWQLRRRDGLEPVEFDAGRRQGKGLVVHMKGVNDRTTAETFKGIEILVPATMMPALEEGDFYWRQLQGLAVWCHPQGAQGGQTAAGSAPEKVLLGTVDHLIETGANDVLVIRACEGSVDLRERLIPYLPGDVVTRVDLEAGVIEVNWYLEE